MWSWLVSLFLLWCIKVQLPLLSYSHKKYLSLPFQTYVVPITGYFLLMKLPLFAFCRSTPLQVIHILGNFMRIWSVYLLYSYLSNSGDSIVGFIFSCLVPTSVIFLVLQKPWKGRPLPNSQVLWFHHVLEITSPAIRWPFHCIHSRVYYFRLFLQLSMEESWHYTLYCGVKDFLLVAH